MRFLNDLQPQHDLTYDDVFMVPNRSSVTSRLGASYNGTFGTLAGADLTAIVQRTTPVVA